MDDLNLAQWFNLWCHPAIFTHNPLESKVTTAELKPVARSFSANSTRVFFVPAQVSQIFAAGKVSQLAEIEARMYVREGRISLTELSSDLTGPDQNNPTV